jgi:outer membrane biogenesis lipoprotein LolB
MKTTGVWLAGGVLAFLAGCTTPPQPAVPDADSPKVAVNTPQALDEYGSRYRARIIEEELAKARAKAEAAEQARIKALTDYVEHRRAVIERNTPRGVPVAGSARVQSPAPLDLKKLGVGDE